MEVEGTEPVLSDKVIIELAQKINQSQIYTEICELYGIEYSCKIEHLIQKLDYKYIKKEPIDKEYK